jgi:uncharacterized membrane protein YfcA
LDEQRHAGKQSERHWHDDRLQLLQRDVPAKAQSGGARLILLFASGLLLQREVWFAALCLLPFMALGLYVGHRLHVRLNTAQIGRIISALLLLTGASILVKATGSG